MSYHRPNDLRSAMQIASDPTCTIIAGGTDIFPAAKQGQPLALVLDLTDIPELAQITQTADGYRIGAAVTWTDVVRADLPAAFDGLKQAAKQVGSIQIQNAATLVGNICNASPAADGVPPLLTLDAQVEIASTRGLRHLALSAFIAGVRQTALAPDELVTAILIPHPPNDARGHFEKLGSRAYLVISIAMVSAIVTKGDDGRVSDLRIAVGACSTVAQRLYALEEDCIGKRIEDIVVTPSHLSALAPIDDVRGSADYRRDAVLELCLRAIKGAA